MTKPLMKCGHAANSEDKWGNLTCAICVGLNPGATVEDDAPPSIQGRMAQCAYCKKTRPSDLTLPFFEYCPTKEYDSYYSGCRGWD